jgi:hypothetical protein
MYGSNCRAGYAVNHCPPLPQAAWPPVLLLLLLLQLQALFNV